MEKCLHHLSVPFIPAHLAAVSLVHGMITLDSLLQLLSRHSWHACHKSLGSRADSVFLSGALGATRRGSAVFLLEDWQPQEGGGGQVHRAAPECWPSSLWDGEQNDVMGMEARPGGLASAWSLGGLSSISSPQDARPQLV